MQPELNKEKAKELALGLIKDNLKSTCFILGLQKLGVLADPYHLNLEDSIFKLIGFESDDFEEDVFEKYSILIEEIASLELLEDPERLKAVCNNIYESLIKDRELQQQQNKN